MCETVTPWRQSEGRCRVPDGRAGNKNRGIIQRLAYYRHPCTMTWRNRYKFLCKKGPRLNPAANIPALNYRQTRFITSAPTLAQCPPDSGVEVAFAGRSNAGKSSAINVLTDNRGLAKTSKTPGRTQLINFFAVSDDRRLVDLPGYGFAKVPLEVKQQWQRHLEDYLRHRQSLHGLVLLMDCRHPLQDFDRMMLEWARGAEMPVHLLLTKADKLSKGAAQNALLKVQSSLTGHPQASAQLFSALKKTGLDRLRQQLDTWLATDAG